MSGATPRFRYALNELQRDQLARWVSAAEVAGLDAKLNAALRKVDYRLRFEADTWGSHDDTLIGLDLPIRHGDEDLLIVYYGVRVDLGIVFVREFHLALEFWEQLFPSTS